MPGAGVGQLGHEARETGEHVDRREVACLREIARQVEALDAAGDEASEAMREEVQRVRNAIVCAGS